MVNTQTQPQNLFPWLSQDEKTRLEEILKWVRQLDASVTGQSTSSGGSTQGSVDMQKWWKDVIEAVTTIAPVVVSVVGALNASPQGATTGQSTEPVQEGNVSPTGWIDGIFPGGWLPNVTAGFIARPLPFI
jgi:hypothetical protein